MKEDADEYRQTADAQADDRHMVDGQMQVSGGKECLHALSLTTSKILDKIEGWSAGQEIRGGADFSL